MSSYNRAAGAPGEKWSGIPMWSDTYRRHPESHAFGIGEAGAAQCWSKLVPNAWVHCVIVFHRALSLHYREIRSYLLHLSGGTHSRLAIVRFWAIRGR